MAHVALLKGFAFFATLFAAIIQTNAAHQQTENSSISNQDSSLAEIQELQRRLRVVQNFQPVTLDSKIDAKNEDLNTTINAKRSQLLEAFKRKLREKPLLTVFTALGDEVFDALVFDYACLIRYDVTLFENLTEEELRSDFGQLAKNTMCSVGLHAFAAGIKRVVLECGNLVCIACIAKQLKPMLWNVQPMLQCAFCRRLTAANADFYVATGALGSSDSIHHPLNIDDPYKTTMPIAYFEEEAWLGKKCPKITCRAIIHVHKSAYYNKYRFAGVKCANGHEFCVNCHASFDHAPLTCSEMANSGDATHKASLFFAAMHAPFQGDDARERICTACDHKTHFVDVESIEDEAVRNFLGSQPFAVCPNCKRIEVAATNNFKDDDDKQRQKTCFEKALFWRQTAQNFADKSLFENVSLLVKACTFCLMVMTATKRAFSAAPQTKKNVAAATMNFYVLLWQKYLAIYTKCIESSMLQPKNENATSLSSISSGIRHFMREHKLFFDEKNIFVDKSAAILQITFEKFEHMITQSSSNWTALSSEYALEGILQEYFWTAPLLHRTNGPTFDALADGCDPLAETAAAVLRDLPLETVAAMKNELGREISDEDLRRLVRMAALSTGSLAKTPMSLVTQLEKDAAECLLNGGVQKQRVCAALGCSLDDDKQTAASSMAAASNWLPICGHAELCNACTSTFVRQMIAERRWHSDASGVVPCFVANCPGFFLPHVLRLVLGASSASWQAYDGALLLLFSSSAKKQLEFVECTACHATLLFEGESHNPKGAPIEDAFCRQNALFLRAVKCVRCGHEQCANCSQSPLHYATPCGTNIAVETAHDATACPGCGSLGHRDGDCPSTTCLRCRVAFCFACGLSSRHDASCANGTYPAAWYNSPSDRAIVDGYHESCRRELAPLISALFAERRCIAAAVSQLAASLSAGEHFATALYVAQQALLAANWLSFKVHFMAPTSRSLYEAQVTQHIAFLRQISGETQRLLAEGAVAQSTANCALLVTCIEALDAVVKKCRISNKIVLTPQQLAVQ